MQPFAGILLLPKSRTQKTEGNLNKENPTTNFQVRMHFLKPPVFCVGILVTPKKPRGKWPIKNLNYKLCAKKKGKEKRTKTKLQKNVKFLIIIHSLEAVIAR